MFKIENIIKGPLTSIAAFVFGCALGYGWWIGTVTDVQAICGGIAVFALIWMRDKLPSYIGQFFIALIEKITGKKIQNEKNTPPPAV